MIKRVTMRQLMQLYDRWMLMKDAVPKDRWIAPEKWSDRTIAVDNTKGDWIMDTFSDERVAVAWLMDVEPDALLDYTQFVEAFDND